MYKSKENKKVTKMLEEKYASRDGNWERELHKNEREKDRKELER